MKTAIPAAVLASPEPLLDGELAQRVAGGDVRAFGYPAALRFASGEMLACPSSQGVGRAPHISASVGAGLGPVVDGFGLCSWILPPTSVRVVRSAPLLSRSPNLSLPAPGSPLSSILTRNVTVKLPAPPSTTPCPQISRALGKSGSMRYPVMLVLRR